MRVVFLDIDGVLNSDNWVNENLGDIQAVRAIHWEKMIDPRAVARLNQLLNATGAEVVFSTSWRHALDCDELARILRIHGFTGSAIGATPDRSRLGRLLAERADKRGLEIQDWLDEHPGVDSFVILDDDADMEHLASKLVQTDSATGLLDEHVQRAISLLEASNV